MFQLEGRSGGGGKHRSAFGSAVWSDDVLEKPTAQASKKVSRDSRIPRQRVVLYHGITGLCCYGSLTVTVCMCRAGTVKGDLFMYASV